VSFKLTNTRTHILTHTQQIYWCVSQCDFVVCELAQGLCHACLYVCMMFKVKNKLKSFKPDVCLHVHYIERLVYFSFSFGGALLQLFCCSSVAALLLQLQSLILKACHSDFLFAFSNILRFSRSLPPAHPPSLSPSPTPTPCLSVSFFLFLSLFLSLSLSLSTSFFS
jgi:hypothetical protein